MKIIPAIDIIDGKCVRLTKGDYKEKKIYNENPLEVAKEFEAAGLQYLHLVDLDGAKARHIVNYKMLEKICTQTGLQVDVGGGIKSDEDVHIVFASGATQITAGSTAVTHPEKVKAWLHQYGNEKIILGADVSNNLIAINGWMEKTEVSVFSLLEMYPEIKYVICTDISRDGMLQGPSFDLYKEIQTAFPEINLIASGGISHISDIEKLSENGLHGAILGKAIYENKITLKQLAAFV